MRETCSVAGCDQPHIAKSFCESHYRRWKRWNNPLGGRWWEGLAPEERFWVQVDKRGEDECWPWLGSRMGHAPHQYGSVWDGSYRDSGVPCHIGAHRFSWQVSFGDIPDGIEVCHHCDFGLCVNPRHLFLGTHTDNIRNALAKGRHRGGSGERNRHAKLTRQEVEEARSHFTGQWGQLSALAREYGVASGTMSKILKYQTWK